MLLSNNRLLACVFISGNVSLSAQDNAVSFRGQAQ
jgi:hypothetical protein